MLAHKQIKEVLKKIGREQMTRGNRYYRVFDGDKTPMDARYKKRHFTWHPDVYWKGMKGEKVVFEVSLSENFRTIAGEIVLAARSDVDKIYVLVWRDYRRKKELINLIGDSLKDEEENILKWGASAIDLRGVRSKEDLRSLLDVRLAHQEWVWEQTAES